MTPAIATRPLDDILDRARWAPSGDNRQSCRFEIVADDHVIVHGFDTRHDCVYDLDGSSSQIAVGALLETMRIAASMHAIRIDAKRRPDSPAEAPLVDVRLVADPSITPDPLSSCIESRTVNRRPLSTRSMTTSEREALAASAGADHEVVWREDAGSRRRIALLLFRSARIRLTMPEAYLVHRDAIEWGARFSVDRVPEAAVGLDPVTARLMRWVMKSWTRVHFFNRFLAGTWIPRIQLDALPAVMCAAHFVIVARNGSHSIDDFIAGGRALQRFWLTAARLGLQLQPELTPLIFARYDRARLAFSQTEGLTRDAGRIAALLEREFGKPATAAAVFMGRIGAGSPATSRSLRLPIEQWMIDSDTQR
ncbi:MAG: molybdopterin biosynthesis protein MoeY [Burkholderiaceae bacterium]